MRLIHYSPEPLILDRLRDYGREHALFKPDGLWVSVEGEYDWRWWCEAEEFALDRLAFATEVRLDPRANILILETLEALDNFNEDFGIDDRLLSRRIDWARVATFYDGIIIAPYQWERRMTLMWYYGWDCASGCIWNLHAVQSIALDKRYEPATIRA